MERDNMLHRTGHSMASWLLPSLLPSLLPCLLLGLLSGCAISSQSAQSRSEISPRTQASQGHRPTTERAYAAPATQAAQPADISPSRGSSPDSTSTNSAVASLLQQAAQARAAGSFARAQSLAERAQGLEPRQGHSYLELARIYQANGDANRSRQMALRGLQYSGNDAPLHHELQRISQP